MQEKRVSQLRIDYNSYTVLVTDTGLALGASLDSANEKVLPSPNLLRKVMT